MGALWFSRGRFTPGAWLGFFFLVLVHEVGHAWVVRRVGAKPLSIDVHGFGGLCTWRGQVPPIERALIAWGGVVAQLLVYGLTELLLRLLGPPQNPLTAEVVAMFGWPNITMAAFNLIPIRPLDGAEAWPLFALLWKRDAPRKPRVDVKAELARRDASLEEADRSTEAKAMVDQLFSDLERQRDEEDR